MLVSLGRAREASGQGSAVPGRCGRPEGVSGVSSARPLRPFRAWGPYLPGGGAWAGGMRVIYTLERRKVLLPG